MVTGKGSAASQQTISLSCDTAGHSSYVAGDAQSCYLLLCKEVFDQGAHNLLWGPGRTDVGEDEVAMCLLSIADPA